MKKMLKIFLAVIIIAALVGVVIFYLTYAKPNSDIKKNREAFNVESLTADNKGSDCIHFLKTGSSDAILIESDGHFAMVDCGEDTDNPRGFAELELDGYEEEVLAYLKKNACNEQGRVKLDFVLGTHSHSDHIGGFDTIISDDMVDVGVAYLKVYDESKINIGEVEEWDNKEVYQQMIDALDKKSVPVISEVEEKHFKLGNFDITLFNTEYDTHDHTVGENDNSFGVLIEKNGARVFLAGDIDNYTGDEDRIGKELGKIDVLKVGHHSYSHSTTAGWLKNLQPKICVVTNDYEKTDKRTLRRITRISKCPILTTGAENGIIVSIDDNGNITCLKDIY